MSKNELPPLLEITPLEPGKKFVLNTLKVPGSKSYTNRALLLAAVAKGKTTLRNPLFSEDSEVLITALQQLGVEITLKKNTMTIEGTGGIFNTPTTPIFLQNAGTAVRFLTAILSATGTLATITGNERMQLRPIQDLVEALNQLGANIQSPTGCPPLTIQGKLHGGKTTIAAHTSSQFLSGLLMAAPLVNEPITIEVEDVITSKPYIEMTLSLMESFGVQVQQPAPNIFEITPQTYQAIDLEIEGDASSATYPFALAALHGKKICITNIPHTTKQADIKFLEVIEAMDVTIHQEPSGWSVTGPQELKPLGEKDLRDLPDAAMTVAILCAFAHGRSKLTGLHTLRDKETDRLTALTTELQKIGCEIQSGPDFLEINGKPEDLHGNIIETYNDHRMAMCFAVAGSKIPHIKVKNPICVQKTYPMFWEDLSSIGIPANSPTISNIILCGMRGSGKNTIGKLLAEKLKFHHLDTDTQIQEEQKITIPQLVKKHGWEYFRNLEKKSAEQIPSLNQYVISVGGGYFLDPENISTAQKNSLIILLVAPSKVLAQRIGDDPNRPRFHQNLELAEELETVWQERKKLYYTAADLMIDSSGESPEEVVHTILHQLQEITPHLLPSHS